jgi:hypothetical protein
VVELSDRRVNLSASVCTPISVAFLPEPLITWVDLRGVRFEEPFFRHTLARVEPERPKLITGIEALRSWDGREGLDPSLIIFHTSRCGSTLLAQMLAALPTKLVISEPPPINQALTSPLSAPERVELVRLLVRAFGRNQPAVTQHLVLKLSSWNVRFAALVRQAFPQTPLLWLQRDPAAVVASQLARPAGWTHWHRDSDPALTIFELTVEDARSISQEQFILRAIEAIYAGAAGFAADGGGPRWQVVDYAELPQALWERIAPHARLTWKEGDLDRLRERSRFNSKANVTEPFVTPDAGATLSDEAKRFVAERIQPLYRALGHQEPIVHQLQDRRVDG